MQVNYDVCAVGNAIIDVLAPVDDAFLTRHGIAKGAMTLTFDAAAAEAMHAAMESPVTASGGSAANTMAGLASLGGRAAYIGKVADDAAGAAFRAGMTGIGVAYDTPPHGGGPSTARCLIHVTPDGQRSMTTWLGCSPMLEPADLDASKIAGAGIVFLEGYLFDAEAAKAAFVKAAEIAHAAGRKVALTLSDLFCVERHKAAFRHLVAGHVDILFANEAEINALYDTDDFRAAVHAARADCGFVALTRSEKGSVLSTGDEIVEIPADPVARVVDTTGAGDLYAAGVLHGLATGRTTRACGQLGALAAGEIISHFGARPETSLADLARARGL